MSRFVACQHFPDVPQSDPCQWCIPWPTDPGQQGKDRGGIGIGGLIPLQGDNFSIHVFNELVDPTMPLETSVVSNYASSFRCSHPNTSLKALAWIFSEGLQLG